MTAEKKDEAPGGAEQTRQASQEATRRGFLKVGLAVGVVAVFAGIAAVTRSLISPPNPPQAQAVQPPTAPQTSTATETVTETVTVGSVSSGNQSASASQTVSSSSSSTSTSTTSTTSSPFPKVMIATLSDVSTTTPVYFNYPLEETPNILVKLGAAAPGGVGPDNDIVAFSQVCQHLGCIYGFVPTGGAPTCDTSYKAPGPEGYCCCHGAIYDLANAGAVLSGPAPRPVPQVTLEFDSSSGNIYAVGMGPPSIFGHDTGSSNVLNDLQGGTPVSG